jgi:hypothetical protein
MADQSSHDLLLLGKESIDRHLSEALGVPVDVTSMRELHLQGTGRIYLTMNVASPDQDIEAMRALTVRTVTYEREALARHEGH